MLMLLEVGAGLEVDTSCRKAVAASSGAIAPGRLPLLLAPPPPAPPLPEPWELCAPPRLFRVWRPRAPHGISPGSAASSRSAVEEPEPAASEAGSESSALIERRAR